MPPKPSLPSATKLRDAAYFRLSEKPMSTPPAPRARARAASLANQRSLPAGAYFPAISNFPHANLRHYAFRQQGLPDIAQDLAARGLGFVMRRAPAWGCPE